MATANVASAAESSSSQPDDILKVALDMVASGLGDVMLVERMLEKQLSRAARAIIARVASGQLNVSTADQHLRLLLSQSHIDVVMDTALDLLGSGEGDIELMEAMLGISATNPMRAVLDLVASKKVAPSHVKDHLKRLINIANVKEPEDSPASLMMGRIAMPNASDISVATSSTSLKRESLASTLTSSITKSTTPAPFPSANATSQIATPTVSLLTSPSPVSPHTEHFAPASLAQGPPGNILVHQRKRGRSEEVDNDHLDIKRVSIQTRRQDSHMNLRDMITHITQVTKRPPTSEQQRRLRVPKEAGYFATSNFDPYGPDHPDKAGRVNTAHYGTTDQGDLGLCYATWCRGDRQCLVGKTCPWRHYLDKFAIGYIWRCGEKKQGHKFLLKALSNLQAGDHEPAHTFVPIPKSSVR